MPLPHVPTPVQEIFPKPMADRKIRVLIKRDDMTHPVIMGNKWRKLKYNLEEAKKNLVHTIVTYGGAYSNHIAAVAAACELYGINGIGIYGRSQGYYTRGSFTFPYCQPFISADVGQN